MADDMNAPGSAPKPAPQPAAEAASGTPTPPVRRGGRWLLWSTVGLVLLTLLAAAGGTRWALYSSDGARWLLARAPGVQATGVEGSLLGDSLRIQQLQVRWANDQASLTLDKLELAGVVWRFRPAEAPGLWLGLDIQRLAATQAVFVPGPPGPDSAPLQAPGSLKLPVQLKLALAELGRLQFAQQPPATELRVENLVLDNRASGAHAVGLLQGQWQGVAARASAQVANSAPFQTSAQVSLSRAAVVNVPAAPGSTTTAEAATATTTAGPAWSAELRADGPLERLAVQADLRGAAVAAQPAQAANVRVTVLPFQSWPVGELDLSSSGLDLSALLPDAPQTRLSATASVRSRALDQPVQAELRIVNTLPGRYNEGRLPLTRLDADLSGRIDQMDRIDVSSFRADFADAVRAAGSWSGNARWQGTELTLDTRLVDVAPGRLDGRAAAMTLSGPLKLVVQGLPSPDPAASERTALPWQVQVQTALQGMLEGAPQPVALKVDAQLDANRVEIKQALAETGDAKATASARLQRANANPASRWQLTTKGELSNFDPVPWVPGGSGAEAQAWQRGPHRLSGQWELDVRLPSNAQQLSPLVVLQRLAGNGSIKLLDSVLAGLPLQADVQLDYAPDATRGSNTSTNTGGQGSIKADFRLAGNTLTLTGSGNPAGDGQTDQLKASLQADQLAALAPLLRIVPGLSKWVPTQGDARLQLSANGRWPAVRTEGQAQIQKLKAGTLQLTEGAFDWTLDTGPGQQLAVTLDVAGLQLGQQRAEQLRGRVSGNLLDHRIAIEALLPLLPPPAAASVLGLSMVGAPPANPPATAGSAAPGEATRSPTRTATATPRQTGAATAARAAGSANRPAPGDTAAVGTRALLVARGTWLQGATVSTGASSSKSPGDSANRLATTAAAVAGGGLWRADIDRIAVGGWDGRPLAALPAVITSTPTPASAPSQGSTAAAASLPAPLLGPTWADASGLRVELSFGEAGDLLQLRAAPGRLQLAGTAGLSWEEVLLNLQGPQAQISLRAELLPFAVAPLLARMQPDMGWAGDLQIGASIVVQATERFDADIQVRRTGGDLAAGGAVTTIQVGGTASGNGTGTGNSSTGANLGRQAMGLTELRLALLAREGLWNFQVDAVGAQLGGLRGQVQATTDAAARWPQADVPIDGRLQLRVPDVGIWNAWVPAGWRLSGQVQGMAAIGGTFGAPRYTGELLGSQLALRNLLQGVNVSDGQVRIKLEGETAEIERFAFRGGDGTLSIVGDAVFGTSPRANLKLEAEKFRLLGRVDRQLIASGQAQASFDKQGFTVKGGITVDEGLFDISASEAPSLDDDVSVRRPGQPPPRQVDVAEAQPKTKLDVDIDVDMGRNLRLRGYGVDTALRGKLKVTSPGGLLAFNGTINTADGTYTGYGQKMVIQRGIVAFSGPLDTARLDLLAVREGLDILVGVAATGPLGSLRIRLVSEPEMSENAKLSWLLLGREPDELGRNETALLQRAAMALLSGEGAAPTDTLLSNLGIDELSLRQTDDDTRDTVVTLGKQLSKRLYLGYERGFNATTGTWQLIYRIAQRFTLRAQSGLENSLDLIWIWRRGEAPAATDNPPAVRKSVSIAP